MQYDQEGEPPVNATEALATVLEKLPDMESERLVTLGTSFLESLNRHFGPEGDDLQMSVLVGQLGQNELLRRLLARAG